MTASWWRIFLFYCGGVAAAGQIGIAPPLLPALQYDLDMRLATAGATVSIITFASAVFGLPAGGWCERVGYERALRIGVLIMAAAAAICAVSTDTGVLLTGRGLSGAGYLLVVIACPSLIASEAEPRYRSLALSIWGTFVPVGIALFEALAAVLVGISGWRAVFAVDAILLTMILPITMIATPRQARTRQANRSISSSGRRSSLSLAAAFFCFALLFLALAGILPVYLVQRLDLQLAGAGRIVAVATACGIAGSLYAGWAMRRGAVPRRLVAVGLITSTAIAALTFRGAIDIRFVGAGFAASFALGGMVPAAMFASVPLIAGNARAIGSINGLLAQAGSLGSLAGPPLLGLCVERGGWSLAPIFLLGVAAVGSGCALLTVRSG